MKQDFSITVGKLQNENEMLKSSVNTKNGENHRLKKELKTSNMHKER